MQAFQLSLVPDEQFPQFKRLTSKIVDVPLSDILLKGIHPWGNSNHSSRLVETVQSKLNASEALINELRELGYSHEFTYSSERGYYREGSLFERFLADIHDHLYFVDALSYQELVAIAKKALGDNWTHQTVYNLLSRIFSDFNSLRDFLKSKSKQIKLSGYQDIGNYDLSQILTLDDFKDEDKVLIGQALPITNFRPSSFLKLIADNRGLLKLTDSIGYFQLRSDGYRNIAYSEAITFSCTRKGESIRLLPSLMPHAAAREHARLIAERWRRDQGRYCFTTDIKHVEEMIEEANFQIGFPNLNYKETDKPSTSNAGLTEHRLQTYAIGGFIQAKAPGDVIKKVLNNHEVSMTGRKEELLEKLAKLAASVYRTKEKELDDYFSRDRFIKIEATNSESHPFDILNDCDLKNIILAMYVTRHQRGNTILIARHTNDTYDLISLAKALISGEVNAAGAFLRVK